MPHPLLGITTQLWFSDPACWCLEDSLVLLIFLWLIWSDHLICQWHWPLSTCFCNHFRSVIDYYFIQFCLQVIFTQTLTFKTRMTCLNTSSTLDSGLSGGWKEGLPIVSDLHRLILRITITNIRTILTAMHAIPNYYIHV